MPIWAKIYLLFTIISASSSVVIYKKKYFYILGQILSLISIIVFFLIYYNYLPKPNEIYVLYIIFIYVLYWEFNINLKELIRYFREQNIPIEKDLFKFSLFISISFMIPFFYIFSKVIGSYL